MSTLFRPEAWSALFRLVFRRWFGHAGGGWPVVHVRISLNLHCVAALRSSSRKSVNDCPSCWRHCWKLYRLVATDSSGAKCFMSSSFSCFKVLSVGSAGWHSVSSRSYPSSLITMRSVNFVAFHEVLEAFEVGLDVCRCCERRKRSNWSCGSHQSTAFLPRRQL